MYGEGRSVRGCCQDISGNFPAHLQCKQSDYKPADRIVRRNFSKKTIR